MRLSFLGGVFFLLLTSCLEAPTPPVPTDSVTVSIIDVSGTPIDSLIFSAGDLPCVSAQASNAALGSQLRFTWHSGPDSVVGQSSCWQATAGSSGRYELILTTLDAVGNSINDTLPVLVNTPPKFSSTRSNYIPLELDSIASAPAAGILFQWLASDPDVEDTLRFELRIGNDTAWMDTVQTLSTTGLTYPSALLPSQNYRWQVWVKDRYGYKDSTIIFHFRTRPLWDLPGNIHGSVRYRYSDLTPIRVIAQAPNGDTLWLALDSFGEFNVTPGPSIATIKLFAISTDTQTSSDTMEINVPQGHALLLDSTLVVP